MDVLIVMNYFDARSAGTDRPAGLEFGPEAAD